MKNIITLLVTLITLISCKQTIQNNVPNKLPYNLEKGWEVTGFENPESVVLDTKNNVLYVSNVNGEGGAKDGNGYISKVSLDGQITEKKWIEGLNAPKGLVISNEKLYITDIDELVEVDIKTKEIKKFKVEGATFLNDITADVEGNIYASNTFGFSAIYKLSPQTEKVEQWLKDDKLIMPNGLYFSDGKLFVAGWGKDMDPKTFETKTNGQLLSVDVKSKTINSPLTDPIGNLDGLSQTINGFLLSDWLVGKLLYYSNESKTTTEVVDLPKGSADIYFDKITKSVFIPLMLDNKLLKYSFKE